MSRSRALVVGLAVGLTLASTSIGQPPQAAATAKAGTAAATAAADGAWTVVDRLSVRRKQQVMVRLRDGRVLVAGGVSNSRSRTRCWASAEVYDPALGRWSATGSMNTGRCDAVGIRLRDGRVLVAGGYGQLEDAQGQPTVRRSAELYSPRTGRWHRVGALADARYDAAVAVLPHGRVLVAGGRGRGTLLKSAEVFAPRTGQWTATGALSEAHVSAIGEGLATRLADGDVLVAGGGTRSAERYDVATGTWQAAGQLSQAREAWLFTLPSGQVLAVGGYRWWPGGTGSARVDRYLPHVNRWRADTPLPGRRAGPHVVSLRGYPLVIGGWDRAGSFAGVYWYRPTSRAWRVMEHMPVARAMFGAARLRGGSVLVAGGQTGAELPVLSSSCMFSPRG